VRERAIIACAVAGLVCVAAAFYAFVYRNSGPCGIPESCRVPGALNPHPYTGVGYTLAGIGLVGFALAVFLSAGRRAPPAPPEDR
jgi:hypothetical protein